MLNVIFALELVNPIPEDVTRAIRNSVEWVKGIPEMRTVGSFLTYQGNANNITEVEQIDELLSEYNTTKIIGVWYSIDGLQYGYEKKYDSSEDYEVVRRKSIDDNGDIIDMPIPYPFDFTEYKNYLKDIPEEPPRRPTDEEAIATQVNNWAGRPARDLTTY